MTGTAVSLTDLAKRAGLLPVTCRKCGTQTWTEDALVALVAEAAKVLIAGGVVAIREFGVLTVYTTAARTITTPMLPGGSVEAPAARYVKFRSSKLLKAALNPDPPDPPAQKKRAPIGHTNRGAVRPAKGGRRGA